MKKERESNLELLRIFSALLIILYHYTAPIEIDESGLIINRLAYTALGAWGG